MGSLRERVEELGPVADRLAVETERLRRLPDELAAGLVTTGLPRALVPARYGGGDDDLPDVLDAIEALAYHDGSTAWCGMIAATTGVAASYLPAEWAERIYGDPEGITGGFAMPVGAARPADGGLIVTGRWQWGSGSHHCTWIGGGCWMTDEAGAPAARDDGLLTPYVFFERGEVEIHDTWHVSGLRGTGSNDFEVLDLFVPEGRWIDLSRRAVVDTPLSRFPFFGGAAVAISAVSLGLARRAQDELVALASGKRPFGSAKSLAERPTVQATVARAEAARRSAAALVRETVAEAWDDASAARPISGDLKRRLRLAATNAAWQSAAAVDLVYHAGGGSSIHETSPLQRIFRDVHVATQHGMVSDRLYEPVGRMALGLPTDARQL